MRSQRRFPNIKIGGEIEIIDLDIDIDIDVQYILEHNRNHSDSPHSLASSSLINQCPSTTYL